MWPHVSPHLKPTNTQLGYKWMEETAPVWSLFEIVHKNCPCRRFFCVYWFTVPSLGANCCWYANYFTSPLPLPPTRSPTALPTTNFHSITLVQENVNAKCALCGIVYQAVLASNFKCLLQSESGVSRYGGGRTLNTKARRWCSWLAKEYYHIMLNVDRTRVFKAVVVKDF